MSSQSKKVTYKNPIDENTDYLVPLQYEYKTSLPIQSRYSENVTSSPSPPPSGLFSSIYFPVSLLLYVGIPISQMVIGFVYVGQCPVQELIVAWMIVSGIFGILLVVVGLIIHTQIRKQSSSHSNLLLLQLLIPFFFIILLFIIAWFFAGQVFVFRVKLRVELFDATLPDYCHANLYKSAYILIFIDYLIFLLAIILNVLSFVAPPDDTVKKRPLNSIAT
ncbi:unnamed protein product [Adineta ricciae]|uniref:Uncharacterized protein n=1 Tax=Adineta ricciae TaxID=249248 RepID=A0A815W4V6_ADIRI|nr:unnamed protein product [Adineta ricciae]